MRVRRVTRDTVLGDVRLSDAAEMGRLPLAGLIAATEELVEAGLLLWAGDEDRLKFLPRTIEGEVIH